MRRALALLLLTACDVAPEAAQPAAADADLDARRTPHVWATCGDPVCSTWRPKGLPTCPAWVQPGIACPTSVLGRSCDPIDDCNVTYTCRWNDPTAGPGGCPISLRSAKDEVAYLDDARLTALADTVLGMRLASWHYKPSVADPAPEHVGFLIDDVPGTPAVTPDGGHVDLYGYTTMAVATIQAQQRRIDALEARLAALERRLGDAPPTTGAR